MPAKEYEGDVVLATEGLLNSSKMEYFGYKDECCVVTYLKKGSFQLHSNNFGLKQFSTTVKSFITKALEYKANLNFKKIICMHCFGFLVMNPSIHMTSF